MQRCNNYCNSYNYGSGTSGCCGGIGAGDCDCNCGGDCCGGIGASGCCGCNCGGGCIGARGCSCCNRGGGLKFGKEIFGISRSIGACAVIGLNICVFDVLVRLINISLINK